MDKMLTVADLSEMHIQTNAPLMMSDLDKANERLIHIHHLTQAGVKKGCGPFCAEVYDKNGNCVASASNTVVQSHSALNHAEINALKQVYEKYQHYDLTPDDLTMYVNAEPCMMCTGAIMWSGIRALFYSVPSADVERITEFDEGDKPEWIAAFKKRGIRVYGNIQSTLGKKVLEDYVASGKEIYKPKRAR